MVWWTAVGCPIKQREIIIKYGKECSMNQILIWTLKYDPGKNQSFVVNRQEQYQDYKHRYIYRVLLHHGIRFYSMGHYKNKSLLCFIKFEVATITLAKGGNRDNNYNYPKCPWLGLLSQIIDSTVVHITPPPPPSPTTTMIVLLTRLSLLR